MQHSSNNTVSFLTYWKHARRIGCVVGRPGFDFLYFNGI